ncbi:MarR family winged helix-turn-helix transcriptional regulator [Fundicoccus culcitae]|uniref:MarR family transcriptional regulator n=1 Tax=Fundicoccus culcitae TaxID=2969821 RepID=A0ABY5P7P8_9LACT|nr:MarR family transcriptional regulator [Fundicoccus culcitae]UUX34410.1 MarR family transcriptional regulator [Fundicoccus culcitae]
MQSFMRMVNRTARLSHLYREAKFKSLRLKGMHHSYINNICRYPGISQESLAQKIIVNKSNVARQLNYLEKVGYIYREVSTVDARERLVYPTAKAFDVLPFITTTLKEWNDLVMSGLSEEEQRYLIKMMEKVFNNATAGVEQLEVGE